MTKEAFGWPEEPEDIPAGQSTPAQGSTSVAGSINNRNENALTTTPLTSVDKYVFELIIVKIFFFNTLRWHVLFLCRNMYNFYKLSRECTYVKFSALVCYFEKENF